MSISAPVANPHAVKVAAILDLDFTEIKAKLKLPAPEGQGWNDEQANQAEAWYKRFLILTVKYPEHIVVPNGPIDAFWHQHILDTRRYGPDCERVLGQMLHHYPYFGLKGEKDAAARDDAFRDTNRLYLLEFGEDCTSMGNLFQNVASGMNCNDAGSGTGCGQGCSGGGK